MSLVGAWQELLGSVGFGTRSLSTGETDEGTLTNPSVSIIAALGGGSTSSGVQINEQIAEGLPAIYACVHVISETVGQLPLKLHRVDRKTGARS